MKRIFMIFIIISSLLITACEKKDSIFVKDFTIDDEIELSFTVRDTILTKSFNNLEPFVNIVRRDENINLLVSLGLLDTSGIKVNDITIDDDLDVYIYVSNISKRKSDQLSVPQILVDLRVNNTSINENTNFYIIKENFDNVNIRFNLPETLTRINSQFSISPDTMPSVELLKEDDTIIWDITYLNIVDRYNLEIPIIDLNLKIDALEGEVISTSKKFISTLIDHGSILDYIPNSNILYKQNNNFLDTFLATDLYVYDTASASKNLVYSNTSDIVIGLFSPSGNSLVFTDSNNNLFFLNSLRSKASIVNLEGIDRIDSVSWISNEEILIFDSSKDLAYKYNLIDEVLLGEFHLGRTLNKVHYSHNYFILEDSNQGLEYASILLTRDLSENDFTIKGFNGKLLDEDRLLYLSHKADKNSNKLSIYSLGQNKVVGNIDLNIKDYFIINSSKLGLVENLGNQKIYNYYEYNMDTDEMIYITSLTSPSVYYNSSLNLLYSDLQLNGGDSISSIIYALDLNTILLK